MTDETMKGGEKGDPTARPISDSALKRFGRSQYKDGYAQGWHDHAAAPQAALTDAQIIDALTIPGLNIEVSLEPRELALLLNGIRAIFTQAGLDKPKEM